MTTLFRKNTASKEKHEIVSDIQCHVTSIVGDQWHLLPTPIIFDVTIIDCLLLHHNGQVGMVTVARDEPLVQVIARLIQEYTLLNAKRDALRRAYPQENIDSNRSLCVKLFIPFYDASLPNIGAVLALPLEVYHYSYIHADNQDGLVVELLYATTKSSYDNTQQTFEPLLKIMGENVRSDASPHAVEETVLEPTVTTEPDQEESEPIKSQQETKTHQMKDEEPSASSIPNFFERAKLTEDELVAFFDFEKKLDTYSTISGRTHAHKNDETISEY